MRKWRGMIIRWRQGRRGKKQERRGKSQRDTSSGIPLRGWESVLNTCFPYHIHFEPQSAVALIPAWHSSLLHARPLPRLRASRGRRRREERGDWFISFLNNSLLFSSSLLDRGYLLIYRFRHVGDDSFLFTIRHRQAMIFIAFSIALFLPPFSCPPLDSSSCLRFYFSLVEIIAGTYRRCGRCTPSSRALDKELPDKAIWWV